MLATNLTTETAWTHLKLMQRQCMAKGSRITVAEWRAEPEEEQRSYYNWMRQQVSIFAAGPYWEGK